MATPARYGGVAADGLQGCADNIVQDRAIAERSEGISGPAPGVGNALTTGKLVSMLTIGCPSTPNSSVRSSMA